MTFDKNAVSMALDTMTAGGTFEEAVEAYLSSAQCTIVTNKFLTENNKRVRQETIAQVRRGLADMIERGIRA